MLVGQEGSECRWPWTPDKEVERPMFFQLISASSSSCYLFNGRHRDVCQVYQVGDQQLWGTASFHCNGYFPLTCRRLTYHHYWDPLCTKHLRHGEVSKANARPLCSWQEYSKANPDFAHYADFSKGFLSDEAVGGRYEIKDALMPDSFHPSAAGMRIIASKLEPIVAALVDAPIGNAIGDAGSGTSRWVSGHVPSGAESAFTRLAPNPPRWDLMQPLMHAPIGYATGDAVFGTSRWVSGHCATWRWVSMHTAGAKFAALRLMQREKPLQTWPMAGVWVSQASCQQLGRPPCQRLFSR